MGFRRVRNLLLVLLLVGSPLLIVGGFTTLVMVHVQYPECYNANPPPVREVNYTQAGPAPSLVAYPQLPGLSRAANVSVTMSDASPVSMVTNSTGTAYGLFINGTEYYLAASDDFAHWSTVDRSVVPRGYGVPAGGGLSVVSGGAVFVSATRLANAQNSTIFLASYDRGKDFRMVLNVTLRAKPEAYTGIDTGPGGGFWHGVVQAGNGYLFAGLYNPQGLVYRSEDNGMSWSLVFNASKGSDWHNEIHDLVLNPMNGDLYAVTDDESGTGFNQSILVSADYGATWKMLYSAPSGGENLPVHLTPSTMGFMDGGGVVALGFEGWYKSDSSRSFYLLSAQADGCLQANTWVSASTLAADPFISWWMQPKDLHSIFVLAHENDPTPTHGVGLFTLSDQGKLTTLMTWNPPTSGDWYSVGLLQMAGPCSAGSYGVIASANGQTHLLVVKL